ncbi:phospholipase C/P1 nuclease family protein [Tuwongella immobilis]|uniref:S1 p1 nuclease: Uncharacterized protein n=1 Tax=Tuwongella immobilis TaxID=692036 RepID=A0A6C2YN17_9BACT|nr:hypothetical protein [Tuwongella immobilis]VIP02836.1 s1 p1 nuclease : Uncharacterized protein OS=Granulicella tundricola (strain ATCC BAA-1859 / DSM 23138 / MP5ACTX9) GN=AciX9_1056 PE=4 SV=1 [Tuwongella immobilis]VTS02596.1 s1 p1 nuclease : Uncharacterized protein OS=Granulicella tundricola (strain ATCC BAA-1859 / DSM 23138 / MP5ACTX9) GN=AciX9_1056 PE=4 SV=1 [Tuwongella immobilis]
MQRTRWRWILTGAIGMVLLALGVAPAWWVGGHESIVEAAAMQLPEEMPAFFRNGGKALAHFAGDPDRWKNRKAEFLKPIEEPNHYLDLEDLEGKDLPKNRFKGMDLMKELKKDPAKVGMLPYSILEGMDRLTSAFADYRRSPENPAIPMKCLVYAGWMAHYTTDTTMPLHTTIHFDGKRQPDGTILQKGIHAKIDGFPEKFGITPEEITRGLKAKNVDDPWNYVRETILASHAKIPQSYDFDVAKAFDNPTPESRKFILERCQAGAQFTMDIWYTAWMRSADWPKPW